MTEKKSALPKHDAEYLNAQAVLNSQLGHDPVLKHMIRRNLPLTAETYITLNWGNLPDEIDPEDQELLDALKLLEPAIN